LREDDPVSDEPDAKTAPWSFNWLGTQRIPVHCGHMADDLDLGEWECRGCDTVVHVRDIPGWLTSITRG